MNTVECKPAARKGNDNDKRNIGYIPVMYKRIEMINKTHKL